MKRRLLLLGVITLSIYVVTLHGSTREVGPGQTHTTIGACITAASTGDICNVHTGSYSGTITVNKSITIQNNAGDSPTLAGTFTVTANNVTLTGNNGGGSFTLTFGVAGTCPGSGSGCFGGTAAVGVYIPGGQTGLTIQGLTIGPGAGTGIYARDLSNALIQNNTIQDIAFADDGIGNVFVPTGFESVSLHSTDGTYAHGVRILNNIIQRNHQDGVRVQGQYWTIAGNQILDGMSYDYLNTHPDGIQLNEGGGGTFDGYTENQHGLIYNNVVRNYLQNIYMEGHTPNPTCGATDTQDIWVFNNVVYNFPGSTLVNGINMDTVDFGNAAQGIVAKYSCNIHIYNNTVGRHSGNGIWSQCSKNGTIDVKNNIVDTQYNVGNHAQFYADCGRADFGTVDYDLISTTGPVDTFIDVGTHYVSFAAFQGLGYEAHGKSGSPLTNAYPTPTLQSGSIAIDAGNNLSAELALLSTDAAGNARTGSWDIGAFEFGAGGGGTSFPRVRIRMKAGLDGTTFPFAFTFFGGPHAVSDARF